ncbi:hypothetical protein USDA257_c07110 [Sinorhizobium fredii USDA 257]|uniref:Uncharacterized protein n=1 Tax=Sinorhizobium fredii (strain USDA 257) TaxID=1185652 RepID=I3X098_SINF2|nr:hypothetical protein USDA257_c07110 [Sinorhizobium fredii USDA 257]
MRAGPDGLQREAKNGCEIPAANLRLNYAHRAAAFSASIAKVTRYTCLSMAHAPVRRVFSEAQRKRVAL